MKTAGNATTINPAYTNVNVENGTRTNYTVYWYVKSTSDNYVDYQGSNTVTINPKQVTLSSGTAFYSKVYDGVATV